MTPTIAPAANQSSWRILMGLITPSAPARQVAYAAERMALFAAAIKKLGAATVVDLAKETGFNRETCRRYLNMLVERGAAELIGTGTTHVGAIYGPTETSSDVEFDVSRVTTANWPRGQGWRDPLVAALFGASTTESRQSSIQSTGL